MGTILEYLDKGGAGAREEGDDGIEKSKVVENGFFYRKLCLR